jgi:hypothetical protein
MNLHIIGELYLLSQLATLALILTVGWHHNLNNPHFDREGNRL